MMVKLLHVKWTKLYYLIQETDLWQYNSYIWCGRIVCFKF
jgi:hypothetical protein